MTLVFNRCALKNTSCTTYTVAIQGYSGYTISIIDVDSSSSLNISISQNHGIAHRISKTKYLCYLDSVNLCFSFALVRTFSQIILFSYQLFSKINVIIGDDHSMIIVRQVINKLFYAIIRFIFPSYIGDMP